MQNTPRFSSSGSLSPPHIPSLVSRGWSFSIVAQHLLTTLPLSLSFSLSLFFVDILHFDIKLKVLELNFNVILDTQIPSSRTLVLNLVPNARMCSILFDQTLKLYHINTVHLVGVPYPIIIIFKFF